MEFNNLNQFSNDDFDDSPDFKEIIGKYLIHFKWFVISGLLFGLIGYFYVQQQVPKFNISASLLIKDTEQGSSFSDLSAFESLGLYGSGNNSLENEIQILKSRRLMSKVVKELQLNIKYFIEDSPYDKEQYPNSPILLKLDSDSDNSISTQFEILVRSKEKFEFVGFDEESMGMFRFSQEFEANLGNKFGENKQVLTIDWNDNFQKNLIGRRIIVKIGTVDNVVSEYLDRVNIELINDKISNVLSISIEETVKKKGISFINNLIDQYNIDGINDENEISQTTTEFLDERIEIISRELEAIEYTAQQFKSSKGLIGNMDGSAIYLQSSSVNEKELVTANTQMELVNYVLEELNKSSGNKSLPVNIGLSDPEIIRLITDYNGLVLQRNRFIKSSSEKNPIIVNIDSELDGLISNLENSLNTLKSSLQIEIDALYRQSSKINSRIASVPINEKEFKDIVRQQETKNSLYIFLLQKREESILSRAVSINKSKIIDEAHSNGIPISPNKMITYLAAVVFGLLLPFVVIYIGYQFDTKVHNEKDLRRLRIPYLGDVPLTKSKTDLFVKDGDNSNIAEAFRYIRTNINFMLDNKDKGKTVFVTSTQSGEGKTFTAINLATSLAISGKKTLLLGMDLRAAKIIQVLDLEQILGVTSFIKNENLMVDGITETYTKIKNLHIINSGDIPPNPVELLMSNRVNQLFESIKDKYEYIVVDTAPVGMVTDTIQIAQHSDLTIYVVKANYLDKRMLHIPEKLFHDSKMPNMAMLINGSDNYKGAYGYGYGYGNGKKKTWL